MEETEATREIKVERYTGTMISKKWVLVKPFRGQPKVSDLQLQEEELPALMENEVLCEAQYFSLDPYMRAYVEMFQTPITMIGQQLAKVIESRNEDYPVGTLLLMMAGWRTLTIVDPDNLQPIGGLPNSLRRVPDVGQLPLTLTLGTLGMAGVTAYMGLMKICKPKPGETVFVNSAAGAVGSTVGQIAKIVGCRVIGSCGSDKKCQWLREELGFDYVFNYKKTKLSDAMEIGAPCGIDCYFDNVGGSFTRGVLEYMNMFGRVAVCGAISQYNNLVENPSVGPHPYQTLIRNQIYIEGFLVVRWTDEYCATVEQLANWVREGRLKYKEHLSAGFVNLRKAFYAMLKGENTGKAVVKA